MGGAQGCRGTKGGPLDPTGNFQRFVTWAHGSHWRPNGIIAGRHRGKNWPYLRLQTVVSHLSKDAETLGFSYGLEVLRKEQHWDHKVSNVI